MSAIKTYEVTVDGYSPCKFVGRTPAKARWRAYQAFGVVSSCSFQEFLARSTIRKADDMPGHGEAILVCGKPATRVVEPGHYGNRYVYEGSDVIYTAHHSEIQPAPKAA